MTAFLSQGIDYLGFLDAKLRDLQGYATLAHELIQNADDAKATRMSFDIRDDALVVENDSQFSDCGEVERDECPWKDPSVKGHRCDFHRFRKVAGGDKREEEQTTGAFGIGFISVYQITDRPELRSRFRHWIIRPDAEERQRIEVMPTSDEPFAGTRFRLPWASHKSTLRDALHAQPIQVDEIVSKLIDILSRALPDAILFLKDVRHIDLRRNGQLVKAIERTPEGDQVVVQNGEELRLWRILRSAFDTEAAVLRDTYRGQIEEKRTANITVAIPEHVTELNGLFCACLPTEQPTELPFHINADFYPSTDRKRILFSDDHQGAWNRAAIREAANLVATAIPLLPKLLGPVALWDLFDALKKTHEKTNGEQLDSVFAEFWTRAQPEIKVAATVAIWPSGWQTPTRAFLLERQEEEAALSLLRGMRLDLVHPDLRRHFGLLRAVDVRLFGLAELVQALKAASLEGEFALDDAPQWIQPREARELLGREITILSDQRAKREILDLARQDIRRCAIALARDGRLCAPATLIAPSDDTLQMFEALELENVLLSEDNPASIATLIETLTPARMLEILGTVPGERFEYVWKEQKNVIFDLVDWFAGQSQSVLANEKLKAQLRALPIWPAGQSLYPFNELYMSGSFEDPLGLASLLDRDMRRGRQDFLRGLGYKWLTIERYARELIPRALQAQEVIEADKRRELLLLFAEELSKLRDDVETRNALSQCSLVECQDGIFRTAKDVYFDTTAVVEALGDVPLAKMLPERPEAVRDLYRWLGVADEPRLADILQRLAPIIAAPPTPESRQVVGQIFRHLSSRKIEPVHPVLQRLRSMRWLPARDDGTRWFAPNEIYASYQEYLFSSQAKFLDFNQRVQSQGRDFLALLGVQLNATPLLVVKHLQWCAAQNKQVHLDVYRFLNEQADDPAITQLRGRACLILDGVGYVSPSLVFWNDHPYGRFRHRLTEELRSYTKLFAQLHVREHPTTVDALLVMQEIAETFKGTQEPLEEDAHAVLLACWQQLNDALERGELAPSELAKLQVLPVIPTENFNLRTPVEMFQDDRPGLADRFPNFKGQHTVARMLGLWRAMEAAGVQALSKAVQISLVECEMAEPADDLTSLILERQHLITRVVEATNENSEQVNALGLLDRIRVERVARLAINYELRLPGLHPLISALEHVPAYLDAERGVIYIQSQHSALQWPALARALAIALDPHGDPVQLATGLKEVLSATSANDADEVLSLLGYAQLVIVEAPWVEQGSVGLGAESHTPAETEVPSATAQTTPLQTSNDQTDAAGPNSGNAAGTSKPSPDAPNANGPTAVNEPNGSANVGIMPSANNGTLTPANGQLNSGSTNTGNTSDGAKSSEQTGANTGQQSNLGQANSPNSSNEGNGTPESNGAGPHTNSGAGNQTARPDDSQRQHGKLRTYVTSGDTSTTTDGSAMADRISAIDRAGVQQVLQHERAVGRFPREMPHENPGYDIESCDITDTILRYIEVKSVSGYWDSQGVGLSATQFKTGHLYGAEYWLYIVERAEQADAQIYCIQDPVRQVNQFLYDYGWRALAEDHQAIPTSVS